MIWKEFKLNRNETLLRTVVRYDNFTTDKFVIGAEPTLEGSRHQAQKVALRSDPDAQFEDCI